MNRIFSKMNLQVDRQSLTRWQMLPLLLAFLLVFCTAEGAVKTKKIKSVLKKAERVLGLEIDPLILDMKITDSDDKLIDSAEVFIKLGDESERLEPQSPGHFVFEVSRKGVLEGAVLEIHAPEKNKDFSVYVEFRFQTDLDDGERDLPAVAVDLHQANRLGDESNLAVYYFSDEEEAHATQVFNQVEKAQPLLKKLLGSEVKLPFGVVLINQAESYRVDQPGIWPYRYSADSEEEFSSVIWHEWAETSFNAIAKLETDYKNRWISDGLAELMSHRILASMGDYETIAVDSTGSLRDDFDRLLSAGQTSYDLTDFRWPKRINAGRWDELFQFSEGYPLAHMFFLSLVEEHGDALIAEFLAACTALKKEERKNKRLVNLLESIVGRPLLEEIKNYDVKKAQKMMEALQADALSRVIDRAVADESSQQEQQRAIRVLKLLMEDDRAQRVIDDVLQKRQKSEFLNDLLETGGDSAKSAAP